MARERHPDKGGSATSFQAMTEARDYLKCICVLLFHQNRQKCNDAYEGKGLKQGTVTLEYF